MQRARWLFLAVLLVVLAACGGAASEDTKTIYVEGHLVVELATGVPATPTPTLLPSFTQLPTSTATVTPVPSVTRTVTPVPASATAAPLVTHTPTSMATATPPNTAYNWQYDLVPDFVPPPGYDAVWTAIRNPKQYPNLATMAATGDLYRTGRFLNFGLSSLMALFRYTGDPALLDYVVSIMDVLRGQIWDWDGDGYLNLRWLFDQNSSYYGKDTHHMDEILSHALIAEYTDMLQQVGHPDAGWWADYLLDHFWAKWRERETRDKNRLYKTLTHPWLGLLRLDYLSWQVAQRRGDGAYWQSLYERHKAEVLANFLEPGDYPWWYHKAMTNELECQSTEYSLVTTAQLVSLNLVGVLDDTFMAKIANTYRDKVLTRGTAGTAWNICGSGDLDAATALIGPLTAWGMYEPGGQISERGRAMLEAKPVYADRNLMIPVWEILSGTRLPDSARLLLPKRGGGGAADATPYPYIVLWPDFSWTYFPTAAHTPQPTATNTPAAIPTETPQLTPTQDTTTIGCRGLVLSNEINVRAGPGTSHARVGAIRQGEILRPMLLDPGTDDAYWWVQFEGTDRQPNLVGWSALFYAPDYAALQTWIQLSPDCAGLPRTNQEEKAATRSTAAHG